jgi:hypothetical protein
MSRIAPVRRAALLTATFALAAVRPSAAEDEGAGDFWWSPSDGRTLPAEAAYGDPSGRIGILNTSGDVSTKGHPFFEPLGANGRACVTCHQPADAMSVSAATARARWKATGGKDPLFAAIDGANCPNLPMADEASHSLLLNRGLVRVFLPWPPRTRDGTIVEPEFSIEVVRDPTGCNLDAEHGLASATPTISVYRRPRPVANLKYVTAAAFGVGPFNAKDAQPAAHDPDTGKLVNMNMMADAREPTLKTQALGAIATHLEGRAPSAALLTRLLGFETQIYAAQSYDVRAGELAEPNGPPALGPRAMADGRTSVLGNNVTNYVFPIGDAWRAIPRSGDAAATPAAPRASRLHAATTCSSTGRFGSRTRCT